MTQQIPWPAIYERELVPAIFGPWSNVTVSQATPMPGEQVLDVACGTGIVTRKVAAAVGSQGRVVGLDLNADMLAFASAQPASEGARIEWVEGDACHLPFSDATFDLVLCQGGLQFIPDRPSALREMCRVLKPEGRMSLLLFKDPQSTTGFARLAKSIAPYVDSTIVEHILAPFILDDVEAMQTQLRQAGFRQITVHEEIKSTHFASAEHFVRARLVGSRIRNSMSPETLERALREGTAALQPYEVNGELVFPMNGYLLLASPAAAPVAVS